LKQQRSKSTNFKKQKNGADYIEDAIKDVKIKEELLKSYEAGKIKVCDVGSRSPLTTLGKVIYSLSSGGKSIPAFRESKLTRLLQDSLTANTLTFIVGNVSPSANNID